MVLYRKIQYSGNSGNLDDFEKNQTATKKSILLFFVYGFCCTASNIKRT